MIFLLNVVRFEGSSPAHGPSLEDLQDFSLALLSSKLLEDERTSLDQIYTFMYEPEPILGVDAI